MTKKKVFAFGNFCLDNTGFAKHKKALLTHLFKTGKYDIVEACNATSPDDPRLQTVPWKCIGLSPSSPAELRSILSQTSKESMALKKRKIALGVHKVGEVVKDEKPDIFIGIEDPWAFEDIVYEPWWDKIPCAIHTTVDSLPLYQEATQYAKFVKNLFVWAKFAKDAFHKIGNERVRHIGGIVNTESFFRLSESKRSDLRLQQSIPEDAFVIGFVFRNGFRKDVPKALSGFKSFCAANPEANAYLLLHTGWDEGWNIAERIVELGVDPKRVLTTYVCAHCGRYQIKPFQLSDGDWKKSPIPVRNGFRKDCPFCGASGSQSTISVSRFVLDSQLNEIYNLMDVYLHPFTSGGQELPIQEAKLVELPTLVTSYSCGEEFCSPENGGLPLDWAPFRSEESQFIKASTSHFSISKQLSKVWGMKTSKVRELGKRGRAFVLAAYSVAAIGGEFEKWIDEQEDVRRIDGEDLFESTIDFMTLDLDHRFWAKMIYRHFLEKDISDSPNDYRAIVKSLGDAERAGVLIEARGRIVEKFKSIVKQESLAKVDISETIKESDYNIFVASGGTEIEAVAALSVIKKISEKHPDAKIYIGSTPKNVEKFASMSEVEAVIGLAEAMKAETFLSRRLKLGYIDMYVNPSAILERHPTLAIS